MRSFQLALFFLLLALQIPSTVCVGQTPSKIVSIEARLKEAVKSFRKTVARNEGYVYHHSLDTSNRWGEGLASATQIWVQPPGTPSVGEAYLRAYSATGDQFYLDIANETASALIYGQLKSGGWTNAIDFEPNSKLSADYLNGKGRGKNYSSLDDDQTTATIRFLIRADQANKFENNAIKQSVEFALDSLLKAQFDNGAFPQVWNAPICSSRKHSGNNQTQNFKANFPKYDWRTEGRIKNYWDLYTLNDNVTGNVALTLKLASEVYKSERYNKALKKLGEFLILAQMPEPQPGWAQQYNYEMQPVWARKFEPPAVSGDETQETIETLMVIATATRERRYLQPIPTALQWLQRSKLSDGQLARYYELKTNRPLYMNRKGKEYSLTYSDKILPDHYEWKTKSHVTRLRKLHNELVTNEKFELKKKSVPKIESIAQLLSELDSNSLWVTVYSGGKLVGQPKFKTGERYISSQRFSNNIATICEFLKAQ